MTYTVTIIDSAAKARVIPTPMAFVLPLGTSDFAQIRRGGRVYVDKTRMVAEIVRGHAQVLLLPRPRRFGKTTNLSMLRRWFERPNGSGGKAELTTAEVHALFDGLAVSGAGEDVAARFQRHPVIFLTFKDVKHASWAACRDDVVALLRHEVLRHEPVWSEAQLTRDDREALDALAAGNPSSTALQSALRVLSLALHQQTGEEVVLLIDEYDTPIHEGWHRGYYDEVVAFLRNLLSGGLKYNNALFRGVLTGILRVAKESMFSGLNNVRVYSLLAPEFSESFGFTSPEVDALCALAGESTDEHGIREWYNGYDFGGHVIYNPWSVISYLASADRALGPYWVNTASNDLLRDLLIRGGLRLHAELADLIDGGAIVRPISEDVQIRDLKGNVGAVWSFLLFSGYLKAQNVRRVEGELVAELSIPNREIKAAYTGIFRDWMRSALGDSEDVNRLCRALLAGDAANFGALLQRLVLQSLSFFDTGARTAEAVYHAFLVGLLVQLNQTHVVESNRESGLGRYDVCIRARLDHGGSRAAAVMELKSVDAVAEPPESWEDALDSAMRQIRERKYATGLWQAGADEVWLWAVVFDGKRVRVRVEKDVG